MIKADDLIARCHDGRYYLLPHKLRRAKPMNEYYCRCSDRALTGIRQDAVIRFQVITAPLVSSCLIYLLQTSARYSERHCCEY
jgi:hypothetical protein